MMIIPKLFVISAIKNRMFTNSLNIFVPFMKKQMISAIIALAFATSAGATDHVNATVHADQAGAKINREIYGQFSEHLGSCIYGGLWVGENSPIPNINGYRKDVFEALKALKVPVLRWPGGQAKSKVTA